MHEAVLSKLDTHLGKFWLLVCWRKAQVRCACRLQAQFSSTRRSCSCISLWMSLAARSAHFWEALYLHMSSLPAPVEFLTTAPVLLCSSVPLLYSSFYSFVLFILLHLHLLTSSSSSSFYPLLLFSSSALCSCASPLCSRLSPISLRIVVAPHLVAALFSPCLAASVLPCCYHPSLSVILAVCQSFMMSFSWFCLWLPDAVLTGDVAAIWAALWDLCRLALNLCWHWKEAWLHANESKPKVIAKKKIVKQDGTVEFDEKRQNAHPRLLGVTAKDKDGGYPVLKDLVKYVKEYRYVLYDYFKWQRVPELVQCIVLLSWLALDCPFVACMVTWQVSWVFRRHGAAGCHMMRAKSWCNTCPIWGEITELAVQRVLRRQGRILVRGLLQEVQLDHPCLCTINSIAQKEPLGGSWPLQ